MNKIRTAALFFRVIFQCCFIVLPILLAIAWYFAPKAVILFNHVIVIRLIPHQWPVLHTMMSHTKFYGFLVSLIPAGVILAVLYCLIRLFRFYEKGVIFSIENVRMIRNMGYLLLVGQLLHPVYDVLMSLVLTWHNPVGHRMIGISEGSMNIGIVMIGLLIILVSWIMTEAQKLQEEQQLTI